MPKDRVSGVGGRHAVIEGLRCGHDTVAALATALGVTDNAVRLHLAALERDGLVSRGEARRSGRAGQPALRYVLTSAGEISLSRAYPPALTSVVTSLGARLEPRALRAVLVDAGRRLAIASGPVEGSLATRAESCVALITSLGGRATAEVGRHDATIVGAGCPLAEAVRAEPRTCSIMESLLARHSGMHVVQRCEHGQHPSCRFVMKV